MLSRFRLSVPNSLLGIVLLGSLWGQRTEGAVVAPQDFFRGLDLPLQGCRIVDSALTDREKELLEPDATLVRQYVAGKDELKIELAVIAGHKKRTVHTPGFCLAGGGWETASQSVDRLSAGGQEIPVVRSLIVREGVRMLVTYFFTDGDFSTESLPRYQWAQIVRRVQGHLPIGALVRIRVPVYEDPEAARRSTDEFAATAVPAIMTRLRQARGGV